MCKHLFDVAREKLGCPLGICWRAQVINVSLAHTETLMLSPLKPCTSNTARHVWPLSLCRICKGSVFCFSFVIAYVSDFLLYPFIISNCPLSVAPLLWLCAVTLQSAIQDPISKGRLSRSSPQYAGNPQFPLHRKCFWFFFFKRRSEISLTF